MELQKFLERAQRSQFYLMLLNWSLSNMVPFNKPHGFKVLSIKDNALKVLLPYRKVNLNHIRGIHACALATVSEFTTGFLLLSKLDPKKYRLIMKRLEMEYHYQGKMDAMAEFSLSDEWLQNVVVMPLHQADAIVIPLEIKIYDVKGNHLTTGKVHWQIKKWQHVKTKLAD